MISFAGQTLGYYSPALEQWVMGSVDFAEIWEFADPWWASRNIGEIDYRPTPPRRRWKLNRLWVPAGASRFSVGHFLCDQSQLDAIRAVVFPRLPSGVDNYVPAPLVLDDGINSITTDLYMLPARPLQHTADGGDFYLLTLVDERYFWYFRPGTLTIDGGVTTWEDVYTQIETALGITITVDPISPAYLMPPEVLAVFYEPLPLLLDAVALCVGQKITRALDGSVRAWNADAARDQAAANRALALDRVADGGFQLGA